MPRRPDGRKTCVLLHILLYLLIFVPFTKIPGFFN